ncbi:hypothetical protein E1264_10760 [Actinomadura sp. KC216]|uniref:hypothetical protein n=1 Tax=Actinomadura sp. KC216 TaxID=2530370 RepID=UPI001051A60F|nr:hypothetical protein [Actinomadura sp. KC216]TDB88613.1 hypothetical protein E1264_10760 [Actinomadura sp. KC216]
MIRFRPGPTAAATAVVVAACAVWDPGVPAAAATGLLATALLLGADAAGAHGGAARHLPPLIAGGSCTALVAAVLVLPDASGALVVVAGMAALTGAFLLACSWRVRRPR